MIEISLKNAQSIAVDAVVRTVPQQREVVRGRWRDQSGVEQVVYAKIFMGSRAQRHCKRDLAGVDCLVKANIATPLLLFQGVTSDESAFVAIFSSIQHTKNAEEVWQHLDQPSRFALMRNLVSTIAHHHQAGLIQTDLYLKNFLVQNEVVYTLDGDGIRYLPHFFKNRKKMRNLATLFSKMDVLQDDWIDALYQHYCNTSGIEYDEDNAKKIRYLTQMVRYQVANRYATQKVFRTCTDVIVSKNLRQLKCVANDFKHAHFSMAALNSALANKAVNLKNGNTCTIARALILNRQVVIKRYNIKNFWHGLNRAFRPSRAAKSWANAHRLIISNIATAKPLALVEERFGCLRRRAYYLSEYIDAPDALQFFAQADKLEDKKNVARNLAILFYKLYLLKLSHGDCKASNIKIVNLAPVLIDLDAMQAHSGGILSDWWFERKHIKDLKRLMKNWENDMEVTALLKQAFMMQYVTVSLNVPHGILFRAGIA